MAIVGMRIPMEIPMCMGMSRVWR